MKLRDMSEAIAAACDMKPKAVIAVQAETFRRIRAALDKGERVQIPDFGLFAVKDAPAEDGKPAKKIVRFRQRDAEAGEEGQDGKKAEGRKKRAKGAENGAEAAKTPAPAEAGE